MENPTDHEKSKESTDLAAGVLESFQGMDDNVVLNAIVRIAAATVISGATTREELYRAIDMFTNHFAN